MRPRAIAINAGLRDLTFTGVTGAAVGDAVICVPVTVSPGSLNLPANFIIHNAWVSAAGTVKVRLTVPLITLGGSYSIPAKLFRLAAA